MKIKNITFVKSSKSLKDCPINSIFEYPFIGRSNVGKSSLINAIFFKKIANISSKPGSTKLINHYIINRSVFIVDLPGYGYIKNSKLEKNKIKHLVNNYLLNRKQIVNIFILIDSRHFPMKIDINFIKFIQKNKLSFSIVFTKYDLVNKTLFKKIFFQYKNELKIFNNISNIFVTSSRTKFGCDKILNYIQNINNNNYS